MAIELLPEHLINQIAAGEMVLRPASALKELLENSVDAGASKVEVEVQGGGIALLRVTDNGCGIPGEEMALALTRHATSKLKRFEDLTTLTTLGFRGEALASLASVAQLRLISRPNLAQPALQAELDAQGHCRLQPAQHGQGTTVEVEGLFENLPVRRKFLRSERSEHLALLDVFHGAALASPSIEWVLKSPSNAHKILVHYPAVEGGSLQPRVEKFLKQAKVVSAFEVNSLPLDLPYQLQGWVVLGRRPVIRKVLVNRRWVRCLNTLQAVRSALHSAFRACDHPIAFGLEDALQASFVLDMTSPTDRVDVNVHPAKEEVRFLEPRKVHEMVFKSVYQAFLHHHQPGVWKGSPWLDVTSMPTTTPESPPMADARSGEETPLILQKQGELFQNTYVDLTAQPALRAPARLIVPSPSEASPSKRLWGASEESELKAEVYPLPEAVSQAPLRFGRFLTLLRSSGYFLFQVKEELVAYPFLPMLALALEKGSPSKSLSEAALVECLERDAALEAQLREEGFGWHRFGEKALLTHVPQGCDLLQPAPLWRQRMEAPSAEAWREALSQNPFGSHYAFRHDCSEAEALHWLQFWQEQLSQEAFLEIQTRRLSLKQWLG